MDENNKKHILVVDDEQSIRELVRDILEEEGHRVTVAGNGIEALELITAGEVVDVVISDIRMPVMGGIKLLEKIRNQNPFPPAMIFVTGYSDVTNEEAFAKGAAAYLRKPMSINELVKAVEDAVRTPRNFIKRKYERIHVRLFSKLQYKDQEKSVDGETLILGQGGMFVATESLIPIGEQFEFEILFNHQKMQVLKGKAEVVWQRQQRNGKHLPGMGVKFVEISEEGNQFLAEYVEEFKASSLNHPIE